MGHEDPADPADSLPDVSAPPGAQRERTALAWQRTVLGVALGGIILTMTALKAQTPLVGGAAAMLTVYVALRLAHRGPAHELRGGRLTATWPVLVRVVGVVVALGALGATMAVLGALRATG